MAARQAPVTIERIERAMDEVALAIDMAGDRGDVYLPIFERLVQEAELARRQLDTKAAVAMRLHRIGIEKLEQTGLIGYTLRGTSTKTASVKVMTTALASSRAGK